jgi:hypothetical protein
LPVSLRDCTERCTEGSALPTTTKRISEMLRVTQPRRHHPVSNRYLSMVSNVE